MGACPAALSLVATSHHRRTGSAFRRAAWTRRAALHALGAVAMLLGQACAGQSDLPVYWTAPQFTLLDQDGAPFSSGDIGGRVVVANFIYTSCTDICPMLSATMRRVQERLRQERLLGTRAILLSFSVDPEHDTPPVLRAYAQRFSADPAGWKFLTGDPLYVQEVIVRGFKLGVQRVSVLPGAQRPIEVTHTDRFALIDGRGQIRAFLRGSELNVEALIQDLKRLADQTGGPRGSDHRE
jgi:protein SCO1/2